MNRITAVTNKATVVSLKQEGYAFLPADRFRFELESIGATSDWDSFTNSWHGMPVDEYMADGGRYRRRRHAVFSIGTDGELKRQVDQPHYQSLEYNQLNGGVPRWFGPITQAVADSESLSAILSFARSVFEMAEPEVNQWKIEVHQFRIEARSGAPGLPTPEGRHRDGVDFVLVLLIARNNISHGMTEIFTPQGLDLGHFTLTEPFDAVLIDDHRVYHGVTSVEPLDPAKAAWRDVLVVTFRKVSG